MKLIDLSQHGFVCNNYYWLKRKELNFSDEELASVGITGTHVQADEAIIEPLQRVNEKLKRHGYKLVIKDGYRPVEQYRMVQEKRYAVHGKEHTDALLNMKRMAHSTGRVVDVALRKIGASQDEVMGDKADGIKNMELNFYQDAQDEKRKEFHRLRELLSEAFFSEGFTLGAKKEFWHFEYDVPADFRADGAD